MTRELELASLASLPLTLGLADDLLMRCPTCSQHTPGQPQHFRPLGPDGEPFPSRQFVDDLAIEGPNKQSIFATWMRCANEDCREVLIWIHETRREFVGGVPLIQHRDEWIARPRGGTSMPPIDPLVKPELAQDYREAYQALEISPRLAVVMARSILEDLLREAGYDGYLTSQIKKCLGDVAQPMVVKELLEPLRVLGDWGAHPFKDAQNTARLPVEREVIEWALGTIGRMFDHFVVTPERDRLSIEAVKQLNIDAGRNAMQEPKP